jgi:hypothetical protein
MKSTVVRIPILAVAVSLAMTLHALESRAASPVGQALPVPCDATCQSPPPLAYEEPNAASAQSAVNALNAVNCTGGVSGHCAEAGGSPSAGGVISYQPVASDQGAFASWNNESSVADCSQFTIWTAYRIPWAEYANGQYVMMMPESASAGMEQNRISADHEVPVPDPWTDSMTSTLSVEWAIGGLRPPPTGRLCP